MNDRPDLVALDLLVRVAAGGSVGAAARDLGTTQPHASRLLSRLERQLGLQLLERSPAGSRVTSEGEVVVAWARQALEAVDRVSTGARSLAAERAARLRVVASLTIAEQLAPAWIARFRREQPGHQVRLEVANSEQVLERVLSGEVPLGFVESPSVPQEVSVAAVALDRLVVVVAPEHPWARRTTPLSPAELADAELVLREEGSGTRRTLARALTRAGAPLGRHHLELASTAAVRAAALQGDLPAVLSELGVADQLATGALVEVPVDGLDLARTLRAVWLPSRSPIGDAARLLRIARASHQASRDDPRA